MQIWGVRYRFTTYVLKIYWDRIYIYIYKLFFRRGGRGGGRPRDDYRGGDSWDSRRGGDDYRDNRGGGYERDDYRDRSPLRGEGGGRPWNRGGRGGRGGYGGRGGGYGGGRRDDYGR